MNPFASIAVPFIYYHVDESARVRRRPIHLSRRRIRRTRRRINQITVPSGGRALDRTTLRTAKDYGRDNHQRCLARRYSNMTAKRLV